MPWLSSLRASWGELAQALAPVACVGCGLPGTDLCRSCGSVFAGPPRWTRPDPCPAALPPTATVTAYDGAVRGAVVGLKEHGRTGLLVPLGGALTRSVSLVVAAGGGPEAVRLVPVPSSPQARRARDTDAVADLAREAARRLRAVGLDAAVAAVLRSGRRRADQARLSAGARAENLAGSLRASACATPVVVVDDVITTGATLAEAARALAAAGVPVLGAATVAATQRRHARSR